MTKARAWSAAFLVAIAAAPTAGSEMQEPDARKVLLIGWDGAGRENVRACMAAGACPSLERLAEDGTIVAVDILRITDTKAGWTQILTGYEPERTGVFSNKKYQPIPPGYTVFERLERHFGDGEFFTGAVIGKTTNMDTDAPETEPVPHGECVQGKKPKHGKDPCWNVVWEDGKPLRQIPGKPYHHTAENIDLFENGLVKDEKVAKRAMEVIGEHADEDFFIFVHMGEVDRKGHMFSEDSPEYRHAIENADRWTGVILDGLEALGILDETLVYVTADHGFDEGGYKHWDAPHVFLATNDPLVRRPGERADIAPTILWRFGLDLGEIVPPLDGSPMTEPHQTAWW